MPIGLRQFYRSAADRLAGDPLMYQLGCLAVGLALGAGLGATIAPQVLRAEDAGIYDFIRSNAAAQSRAQGHEPMRSEARAPRSGFSQYPLHVRLTNRSHSRLAHARQERRVRLARVHPEPEPQPACDPCQDVHYATPIEAILNDQTLRRGDTVMFQNGAQVFQGAKHFPYNTGDFADFRTSNILTKSERKQLDSVIGHPQAARLQAFEEKKLQSLPAASAMPRTAVAQAPVSPADPASTER